MYCKLKIVNCNRFSSKSRCFRASPREIPHVVRLSSEATSRWAGLRSIRPKVMSPETRVMSPAIIRIFHMGIKFCAHKFREDFYSLVLNFAIFLQWQKSEFKYQ